MKEKSYVSESEKISETSKQLNDVLTFSDFVLGKYQCFSFYKYYTREIIFQLFEYPLMSFIKYELLITEDNPAEYEKSLDEPSYLFFKNDFLQTKRMLKNMIKIKSEPKLDTIEKTNIENEIDLQLLTKANISLKEIISTDTEKNTSQKENKKNKKDKKKETELNICFSEGATLPSSNNKNNIIEKEM